MVPKTIYSVTLCKESLCKRRIKLWPFWCVKENKRWYFISVGFPWVAFLIMIPNTIFSRYEPISRLISVTSHSELLLLKELTAINILFFNQQKDYEDVFFTFSANDFSFFELSSWTKYMYCLIQNDTEKLLIMFLNKCFC